MRLASRTRVDRMVTTGNLVRVTGRKDHVISTDMLISKRFDGQIFKYPVIDNRFDRFFPDENNRPAHVEGEFATDDQKEQVTAQPNDFKIKLEDYPVNKSIQTCRFYPLTSSNDFDTKPADQLLLMPYLCEEQIKDNFKFREPIRVASHRPAGSEIPVLSWTNLEGESIEAPNNNRSYSYFPTEQGMFFLRKEYSREVVLDDEKEIYENVVPQKDRFNVGASSVRFRLKSVQTAFNANQGAVIAVGQQGDGLALQLYPLRKEFTDSYKTIYGTNLENYVFAVKGSFFKYDHVVIEDVGFDYAFTPTFNIEIGPFDEQGMAVTRAVSFDGTDITDSVTSGDFFKMKLWAPNISTAGDAEWVLYNLDAAGARTLAGNGAEHPPNAAVEKRLEDLPYNPLRSLTLYLPIRRYRITERFPGFPTDILNDAEIRCPTLQMQLDHFQENTDQYDDRADTSAAPGPGADILSQFDLEVVRSRDEMDEKVDHDYSMPPRREINLRDRNNDVGDGMGKLLPTFAFNAAVREFAGFKVSVYSELGEQLEYVRTSTLVQIPADRVLLLKVKRTRRPTSQNVQVNGALTAVNKKPLVPTHQGWYPNQANAAQLINIATQMTFEAEDPGNEIYILFLKGSLNQNLPYVEFDATAKYIFKDKRYKRDDVTAALTALAQGNQPDADRVAAYAVGNYRFMMPHEISSFVDNQNIATVNYTQTANVPDVRLFTFNSNSGYLTSTVDPFWNHTALARNPDNSPVLSPNVAFRAARAEFDAKYAGTNVLYQRKAVYDEMEYINEVGGDYSDLMLPFNGLAGFVYPLVHPNVVGGAIPFVLPAVPDPLPAGYNPLITPYLLYNLAAGLVIVRGFYDAVVTQNNDTLFNEIDQCLTGYGSIMYFSEGSLQEQNAVGRVEMCRSKFSDVVFQENLFSFGGMSVYEPSSIFPKLDKYPALIQDFDISTENNRLVKFRNFSDMSNAITLELSPIMGFELEIYSQDNFDQDNKSVQSVDIRYPDIVCFETQVEVTENGEYKVKFETNRGAPDNVFLHIERVSKAGEVYDSHQPSIDTISLSFFNQDVKTVSQLSKMQIYNCTRRNSNVRSDVRYNRKQTAGILMSKNDFGNWSRYKDFYDVDNFQGEFIIRESQISKIDETVEDKLLVEERLLRDAQPRKIRVLFLYSDYGLTGSNHNLRFWYK